jgi:hypothetical protein
VLAYQQRQNKNNSQQAQVRISNKVTRNEAKKQQQKKKKGPIRFLEVESQTRL